MPMFWRTVLIKSFLLDEKEGNRVFFTRITNYWAMMMTVAGLLAGFVFTSTFTVPEFEDIGMLNASERQTVFGITILVCFITSLSGCFMGLVLLSLFHMAGEENARRLALHIIGMRVTVEEVEYPVAEGGGSATEGPTSRLSGRKMLRRVRVELPRRGVWQILGVLRQLVFDSPVIFLYGGITCMLWAVLNTLSGLYDDTVFNTSAALVGIFFSIVASVYVAGLILLHRTQDENEEERQQQEQQQQAGAGVTVTRSGSMTIKLADHNPTAWGPRVTEGRIKVLEKCVQRHAPRPIEAFAASATDAFGFGE